MANNNKDIKINKLDADLKSEDDLFKDIDVGKDESGEREPVTKTKIVTESIFNATKGFGKAVQDEVSRTMPSTGNVINDVNRIRGDLVELKNNFSNEVVPTVNALKKAMSKSLPMVKNLLPSKVYAALEKKLASQAAYQYSQKSDEEIQKETIGASIMEVFGRTEKIRAQERLDEANTGILNQVAEAHRHKDTISVLNSINSKLYYQSSFVGNEQTAWMKKMLELNYMQLFTAKEALAVHKATGRVLESKLADVVKNTSLPDEIKIRQSEQFFSMLRTKKLAKWTDFAHNYISNTANKLIKTAGDNLMSGLRMIKDGANAYGDMAGMANEMGGTAAPEASGFFPKMIGKFFGTTFGRKFANLIQPLTSKVEMSASNLQNNAAFYVKGLKDKLKSGNVPFGSFLADLFPDFDSNTNINNSMLDEGSKATSFDNATRQTIVEIIPGYLAKMTKYLKDLVTGTDTEEVQFNVIKRDFTGISQIRDDITERAYGKKEVRGQNIYSAVGAIKSGFIAKHGESSEETFKSVQDDMELFIATLAVEKEPVDPGAIKAYVDNNMNALQKKYITQNFRRLKNPYALAKALVSMMFEDDGTVNTDATNAIMAKINSAAAEEMFKDVLPQMFEEFGYRRNFKDMMDDSGNLKKDALIDIMLSSGNDHKQKHIDDSKRLGDINRVIRKRSNEAFASETTNLRNSKFIAPLMEKMYDKSGGLPKSLLRMMLSDQATAARKAKRANGFGEAPDMPYGPYMPSDYDAHIQNAIDVASSVTKNYSERAKTFVGKVKDFVSDKSKTPMEKAAFLNSAAQSVMTDFKISAEEKAIIFKQMSNEFLEKKLGDDYADKYFNEPKKKAEEKIKDLANEVKSKMRGLDDFYQSKIANIVNSDMPVKEKMSKLADVATKVVADKGVSEADTLEVIKQVEDNIKQVEVEQVVAKAEATPGPAEVKQKALLQRLKEFYEKKKKGFATDVEISRVMEKRDFRSINNYSDFKDEIFYRVTIAAEKMALAVDRGGNSFFNLFRGKKKDEESEKAAKSVEAYEAPESPSGKIENAFHADFLRYFDYRKTQDAITLEAINNIGLFGPRGILGKAVRGGFGMFTSTMGALGSAYKGMYQGLGTAAKGAFNFAGKSMPFLSNLAKGGFNLAGTAVKGAASVYKGIYEHGLDAVGKIGKAIFSRKKEDYVDVYLKDQIKLGEPLMSAKDQEKYGIFKTGAKLQDSAEINEPLFDSRTGNVVITMDHIKHGLVDKYNKPLKKQFYLRGGLIGQVIGAAGNLGKGAMGLLGNLAKGGMSMWGSLGKGVIDLVGKGVSGIMSPFLVGKKVVSRLDDIYRLLDERIPKRRTVSGDADGDGIRDGSYQDQMRKMGSASNGKLRPGDKGPKGGIIAADGSEKDEDGNILSTAADIAQIAQTAGGGISKLSRMAAIAKAGKLGRLGMMGRAGQAVYNAGASSVGTLARGAGFLATKGRALATAGMLAANTMGAGAVGSTIMGGLTTAGGAIAGAASTATGAVAAGATATMGAIGSGLAMIPVAGWVALGLAAAAYGGYKLFKALSNTPFFERCAALRLKAYGFPSSMKPGDLEDFEDRMYKLVKKGKYFTNSEMCDWAEKFGLDPKDNDQMRYFSTWFGNQAVPVFGRYTEVLAALGIDYDDADDMDEDDEKAPQLEAALKQTMAALPSELSENNEMSRAGYESFMNARKQADAKKVQDESDSKVTAAKAQEDEKKADVAMDAKMQAMEDAVNKSMAASDNTPADIIKTSPIGAPSDSGNAVAAPNGYRPPTNPTPSARVARDAMAEAASSKSQDNSIAQALAASNATNQALLDRIGELTGHMSKVADNTGHLGGIKEGLDENLASATKPTQVTIPIVKPDPRSNRSSPTLDIARG
jgi:hypothetical protein